MSFVAYLTQVRMDEAVKLLSTTEDKTYETAQDRKDKGANSKGVIRPDRLRHMFHIHFLKILVKYGYDINLFPHVQRNNVLA